MSVIHKGMKIASNAVTGDTLPIGTVVEYEGETVPEGYEQVVASYGKSYKEYVLYDNATGTTGTVTLSETSANFSYIEIFFKDINNNHNSTKIYQPDGKTAILFAGYADGGSMYLKINYVNILGTSMTKGAQVECNVNGSNGISTGAAAYFTIYRVVGYKEM